MMKQVGGVAMGVALAACQPGGVDLHDAVHSTKAEAPAQAQAHAPANTQTDNVTVDLQPGAAEWRESPYLHQFYDLTKASFADGADKIDFAAYQEKSYAIFRAFGASTGGGKAAEEGMLDHLKDIPRQMVGIVKDDPSVLETYDKFWVALSGPP